MWVSLSGTDPTSTAAACASNIALTNLNFYLAVEQDLAVRNALMSKVSSGSFSIPLPFIYVYKNNLNGVSQSCSFRFSRGHGQRLKRIIHTVWNGTESTNTVLDASNVAGAAKVANYYTQLNNQREQQYNVDLTANLDWLQAKDRLRGSVIQTYNQMQYDWHHASVYDGSSSPEKKLPVDKDNIVSGLDLNLEQKWDFFATMVNGTYNHYTFVIVERVLSITAHQIALS